MGNSERLFYSDKELSRPALDLATTFVQRWDLHPRQLPDGRYICVHEQLNVTHLFAHLRGEITLGTYLLDQQNRARFIVMDADDQYGFARLRDLSNRIAEEGIPSYLENSRRGGHLWLFFKKPVSGGEARAFGKGLLNANRIDSIEIYPKQDFLQAGPGSLIRLPFGIHKLARRRYGFYTWDGQPLAPTIREQIDALSLRQTVSKAALRKYLASVSEEPRKSSYNLLNESTDNVSDRIKASITVLEFVSQFVDLKTTPSGAIGLCPFHDDHHPSFGVNDKGNYWHCFAGCGGGSIIDFWMKLHGCDFTTAITALVPMFL